MNQKLSQRKENSRLLKLKEKEETNKYVKMVDDSLQALKEGRVYEF